ncbi:hypothetical protein ACQP2U_00810 [Nocardia sp. CA-084685]|uniref:hypothetical protein n=1 Tax=Nocardia sp. CA-084685 TaxID=3239970 RepID=UPI003D959E32
MSSTDWRVDRNSQAKIATNRAQMKTMSMVMGVWATGVSWQGGAASSPPTTTP